MHQKRIVFYDGECGLCSKYVQFVLKNKVNEFYFTPLQSKLAEKILDQHHRTINMDTLYFLENETVYSKSTAALRICKGLKFPYNFLSMTRFIIPKFLRDSLYQRTSKRRFDRHARMCILPSEEERKYFLNY